MIFINKKEKQLIITNYKVMFSTFNRNEKFKEIRFLKSLIPMLIPSYSSFFLVRPPYNRLESFYKDKLVFNLKKEKMQYCQKVIIEAMGWGQLSKDEQYSNLSKMDYNSFILNLEKYYLKDLHLAPQYLTMVKGGIYLGNVFKKVNIDSIEGRDIIQTKILQNKDQKRNSTPSMEFNYSSEMKRIIDTLYEKDFDYLNLKK